MSKNVITTLPDAKLIDVIKLMATNNIGSVVVISPADKKPIGIITERDVLRAVANNVDVFNTKVEDIMSKKLITVSTTALVIDALRLMLDKGFRHLPVVSDKGELLGIVSIRDVTRGVLRMLLEIIARVTG